MLRRLIKKLSRAISYFIHGWSSYDWDYGYLYSDIIFKLKRMEKEIRNGWAECGERRARQIRYATYLLNKIDSYDYYDEHTKDLIEKYGERDFEWIETNTIYNGQKCYKILGFFKNIDPTNKELRKKVDKEYMNRFNEAEQHRIRDIERTFKFIVKWHRGWWD